MEALTLPSLLATACTLSSALAREIALASAQGVAVVADSPIAPTIALTSTLDLEDATP